MWRQAIKAKAFDALRGLLPAASLSNVGIYGTGQAYEQLLIRMHAHPLPEARAYAEMMLVELRKVIPSFLTRVDLPDRGRRWSEYLETNRSAMDEVAEQFFGHDGARDPRLGHARELGSRRREPHDRGDAVPVHAICPTTWCWPESAT